MNEQFRYSIGTVLHEINSNLSINGIPPIKLSGKIGNIEESSVNHEKVEICFQKDDANYCHCEIIGKFKPIIFHLACFYLINRKGIDVYKIPSSVVKEMSSLYDNKMDNKILVSEAISRYFRHELNKFPKTLKFVEKDLRINRHNIDYFRESGYTDYIINGHG